ncbi:MAG TPA: ABC transporter permease [Candidatus Anoxymicrobiaceae bacterium]
MKTSKRIPFFLIVRHVRHSNKGTLALIVFLMAIAFINLLFINSLFSGVVESNQSQLINTRTGNVMITPAKGSDFIDNPAAVVKAVDKVPGVQAAAAETLLPGSIEFGGTRGNFDVTAIDPTTQEKATTVSQKMTAGSYLKPGDTNGIILGDSIAGKKENDTDFAPNGIKVGDTVNVITDSTSHPFVVRGVFKTKFNGTDDRAFVTNAALNQIAPALQGKATDVVVRADHRGNEDKLVAEMKAAGVTGNLRTWQQLAGSVREITSSFVTINALMTVVGFFIAAVTIFIIIYVDVTHRRQEVGILRAIGVRSPLVVMTYVLQAAVYSFLGVAMGTVLYFAILFPYFKAFPFKIPIGDVSLSIIPWDYLFRAFTVVAVGMLSGLIPALIGTRRPILDDILNR